MYGVDVDNHGGILARIAQLIDEGTVKCHLRQRLPLTVDGVRKAHEIIESGGAMGKVGLGVDLGGTDEGRAFT